MNTTNRGANRAFLLLTGVLLLAASATVWLLLALPGFARAWPAAVRTAVPAWALQPVVGGVGWLAIAVAVATALLAVLLVVFVTRQGRGHTGTVLQRAEGDHAATRIDLAVPRSLLSAHLDEHPDVLANRVTAYTVHGAPALKVSVRARRGVSPAALSRDVVLALTALDDVLGVRLPALVQVSGGFRARTAARARVA